MSVTSDLAGKIASCLQDQKEICHAMEGTYSAAAERHNEVTGQIAALDKQIDAEPDNPGLLRQRDELDKVAMGLYACCEHANGLHEQVTGQPIAKARHGARGEGGRYTPKAAPEETPPLTKADPAGEGSGGWIGVDLDGTLAEWHGWAGADHIGKPVSAMVERVKKWLAEGKDVRIFTARVGQVPGEPPRDVNVVRSTIQDWCEKHIGARLPVTNVKDPAMTELWDDRAVRVAQNTGEPAPSAP